MDDNPLIGEKQKAQTERVTSSYASFFQGDISKLLDAVEAYANKKAMQKLDAQPNNPRLAERVVPGAVFIPAHPSRFRVMGPGRGPKPKYFIVHRPGGIDFKKLNSLAQDWRLRTVEGLVKYAQAACSKTGTIITFRSFHVPASTHFILGLDGQLIQMVDLCDMSYHTLTLKHPTTGETVSNSNSVGIEIEGMTQLDKVPTEILRRLDPAARARFADGIKSGFPAAVKQKLAWLLRWFHDNPDYGLPLDREHIIGHTEVDPPPRKYDPGSNFDYEEIIAMARSVPEIVAPFYQPPVDILQAETFALQSYAGRIGNVPIGQMREVMAGASSSMYSKIRAAGIRRASRGAYYNAGSTHNANIVAYRGEDIGVKYRTENVAAAAIPRPQQDRTGLGFNYETGEWDE